MLSGKVWVFPEPSSEPRWLPVCWSCLWFGLLCRFIRWAILSHRTLFFWAGWRWWQHCRWVWQFRACWTIFSVWRLRWSGRLPYCWNVYIIIRTKLSSKSISFIKSQEKTKTVSASPHGWNSSTWSGSGRSKIQPDLRTPWATYLSCWVSLLRFRSFAIFSIFCRSEFSLWRFWLPCPIFWGPFYLRFFRFIFWDFLCCENSRVCQQLPAPKKSNVCLFIVCVRVRPNFACRRNSGETFYLYLFSACCTVYSAHCECEKSWTFILEEQSAIAQYFCNCAPF